MQRGFCCRGSPDSSLELGNNNRLASEIPNDPDVEEEAQRVLRSGQDTVRILRIKKSFEENGRKKQAVNGITLGIPAGECFGLLGPNGAGSACSVIFCFPSSFSKCATI